MKQLTFKFPNQERFISEFHGKNIVVTGRLAIKRKELKELINSKWKAQYRTGISKKVDILIVGIIKKDTTRKIELAKQYGIEVVDGLKNDFFS
ncbi:MAG: hypothetical protein OEY79_02335 [Anaplasmataceae bacterium]|nr:cytosolic protein [Candidatus Heimdallarchaeota archaeon]MDH5796363.1 hypothetical protein [Anaplasmataceae bacterium]